MRPIGTVIGDKEPNIYRCEIKISDPTVRPLEYVVAKMEAEDGIKYGIVMRITNIREKNRFLTGDVLDLQEKTGVSVYPDYMRKSLAGQYLVAETEIIDAYAESDNGFKVVGPVIVPRAGTKVFRADEKVLRTLVGEVKVHLDLGILAGTRDVKVAVDANALTRHMVIVGGTGTGKSYFRGRLMEKLFELGVPQINFDVLDEYSQAVKELGGINLTVGRDYQPRLDVLDPYEFEQMIEDYVPTQFQRAIARQGFVRFKRLSRSSLSPPNPRELVDCVKEAAKEYKANKETTDNTVTRIAAFLQDFNVFGGGVDWSSLVKKYGLVNLVFRRPSDGLIRIVVACALREIMELRERGVLPPLVVSFDEAHLIVPRGGRSVASTVVKRLLRYGRHLGIGVMMITQRPGSVEPDALNMPATRVIFAIGHRELGDMKAMLSDLGDYVFNLIPRLEVGTAIVTGTMDVLRHSLYIRIPADRRTTHGGASPELVSGGRR